MPQPPFHTAGRALRRAPCRFTLIEVLIAIAIMAVALGAVLGLLAQAQADFTRAKDRWGLQHSMTQACEFYLLAPPGAQGPPDGLFPQGLTTSCDVRPVAADALPEHAIDPQRGWVLAELEITVTDHEGRSLRQVVRKLVREDDL